PFCCFCRCLASIFVRPVPASLARTCTVYGALLQLCSTRCVTRAAIRRRLVFPIDGWSALIRAIFRHDSSDARSVPICRQVPQPYYRKSARTPVAREKRSQDLRLSRCAHGEVLQQARVFERDIARQCAFAQRPCVTSVTTF